MMSTLECNFTFLGVNTFFVSKFVATAITKNAKKCLVVISLYLVSDKSIENKQWNLRPKFVHLILLLSNSFSTFLLFFRSHHNFPSIPRNFTNSAVYILRYFTCVISFLLWLKLNNYFTSHSKLCFFFLFECTEKRFSDKKQVFQTRCMLWEGS